jgi:hypothetical protein
LLKDHPRAKILLEFSRAAGGRTGPAFDLQWPVQGMLQAARTAFIPSAVGTIEFKLITNPKKFRSATYKYNNLLLSFCSSRNGELDIAPLSNKF